ncbi:hypothetical protein BaRGS_00003528 [Batillaria attramentaria]|uniref:Uncharacterized protein n=1 Tax=Batillaria attramentaria TaxID=370345 RepID=A0ABD0M242_9CAEN
MASSNQHVQQYQGQDRAGHPLKVILLEWVKGSEKVKVQTSTQFLCGLDNGKGQQSGRDAEGTAHARARGQRRNHGEVRVSESIVRLDKAVENGTVAESAC